MSSLFSFSQSEKRAATATIVVSAPLWIPAAVVAAPFFGVYKGVQHLREHAKDRQHRQVHISSPKKAQFLWEMLENDGKSSAEKAAVLLLLDYPRAAADELRKSLAEETHQIDGRTLLMGLIVFSQAGDYESALRCLQMSGRLKAGANPFLAKDAGFLSKIDRDGDLKSGWSDDHAVRVEAECVALQIAMSLIPQEGLISLERLEIINSVLWFCNESSWRNISANRPASCWTLLVASYYDGVLNNGKAESLKWVEHAATSAELNDVKLPPLAKDYLRHAKECHNEHGSCIPPWPQEMLLETGAPHDMHRGVFGEKCSACHIKSKYACLVPCRRPFLLTPEEHRIFFSWSQSSTKGLLLVWIRCCPQMPRDIVKIIRSIIKRSTVLNIEAFSK